MLLYSFSSYRSSSFFSSSFVIIIVVLNYYLSSLLFYQGGVKGSNYDVPNNKKKNKLLNPNSIVSVLILN